MSLQTPSDSIIPQCYRLTPNSHKGIIPKMFQNTRLARPSCPRNPTPTTMIQQAQKRSLWRSNARIIKRGESAHTYGRPVCDAGDTTFRTCFAHVSRCFARFTQGITHVSRMFRDVSRCFARFADESRIRDDSRCFAHVSRTFREIRAGHYARFAHVSRMFRAAHVSRCFAVFRKIR